MKSIAQIKNEFKACSLDNLAPLYEEYDKDERTGVKNIITSYHKKETAYYNELKRLDVMNRFENKYQNDYEIICGIDEVGRGPLAGPVVAGAVVLPKNCKILYINDSKQLSAKKRDELYEEIKDKAISVGIGVVSPGRIDEINILQATYEAMRYAIADLSVVPDLLLNDAVTIPQVPIKQVGIIKGDAQSSSIAAASIMAKVTRDRMMENYGELYEGYGFESNKGYGSATHIQAIKELGPCPIHRSSFIKNFLQ